MQNLNELTKKNYRELLTKNGYALYLDGDAFKAYRKEDREKIKTIYVDFYDWANDKEGFIVKEALYFKPNGFGF